MRGNTMPEIKRPLKVFLCHAKVDKPAVRELYKRLTNEGLDAWLDAENLLPGQNWRVEIPKAIRDSDIVIVCLSENSINKDGYVQKEIKFALDVADEKPEGTIFIIPARLEECETPERLSMYHWVDLFDETGYRRLMLAFNEKSKRSDAVFKLQKQYAVSTLSDETFVKKVSDELEKQEKEGKRLYLIWKEFVATVSRISKRFQLLFRGVNIKHTRVTIIIALIGFIGIIIAGLLSLPLSTNWFHLGATPTQTATTTITLTSTLTITPSLPSPTPTKTRTPSKTPTKPLLRQ